MDTFFQLTEREQLAATLCDIYKDAYGFRPSCYCLDTMSLGEMQAEIERLELRIIAQIEEQKDRQTKAVEKFEALVSQLMRDNYIDRVTAIRWLRQAEDCIQAREDNGDYLCYTYGLPYGYFEKEQ